MSEVITSTISATSKFLHQNSEPFNTTYSGNPTLAYSNNLPSATKLYYTTINVTSSSSTIDVTSLTDAYGFPVTFTQVQHLHVVNNDATNSVTVGGGTNALLAALPAIVEGGQAMLTTNLAVSSSSKIITLVASASTVSTSIVIAGD